MSWKIRHEGSPQAVEGLTLQQVVEGLQDGHWELTDEVMGPQDSAWVPIESHPQLAEAAADIEPPPPPYREDESKIDMNALIDVCLVLLVFFMLTTTYAALQKMLDSPDIAAEKDKSVPHFTREQVKEFMIQVKVSEGPSGPVIAVEDRQVKPEELESVLRSFVGKERKTELLIDHDRQVPHGTVVAIEDAAKGAGIREVHILVPKEELNR
jgi:biopolymer transport protein ExbD